MEMAGGAPLSPGPGLAELRAAFREQGFRVKRRWGQNFLVKGEHLDYMARAADVAPGETVLEVGCGPGCLTGVLLARGAAVLAVEIDPLLLAIGKELLARRGHVEEGGGLRLVQADFLEGKNRIARPVVRALETFLSERGTPGFKVVANLPYCVATPVVMNLVTGTFPWTRMVVTVQDEVADRILAEPGQNAYGRPSVLTAAFARVERLKKLRSGCFWPRPDVDSAILRFHPLPEPRLDRGPALARFDAVLRGLFAHRRKTWVKSLALSNREVVASELSERAKVAGISPSLRAQDLSLEDILAILRILETSA